jgi:hypothetical protein
MLLASFLKTELAFLKSDPQFLDALACTTTHSQFERLCVLAEELLGTHHRANPSARQFREGAI